MLSRAIRFAVLAMAIFSLSGCASIARLFGKKDPPPLPETSQKPQIVESDFEWAKQSFEAGMYEDALSRFQKVARGSGSNAKNESILFYQGKSLHALGKHREAIVKLDDFLERNLSHPRAQEARFTLLSSLAALKEWKRVTLIAADALRFESLMGNRILIQLIWGQALVELGELVGAGKTLENAKPLFDSLPDQSLIVDIVSESKASLAERALWLGSHLDFARCQKLEPELPTGKRSEVAQKSKTWARKKGQCVREALTTALKSYPALSPTWKGQLDASIEAAIQDYFTSTQRIPKGRQEAASREVAIGEIRKHFYQILDILAQAEPAPELSAKPKWSLRPFIVQIEQGLQKLAIKAAETDKSL